MTKIEKLWEICASIEKAFDDNPEAPMLDIIPEGFIAEVFLKLPMLLFIAKVLQNTQHQHHDINDCGICVALAELEK